MAKGKPKPELIKVISKDAQSFLDRFGIARLDMMRNEYLSGLPHDMPRAQRIQRIGWIDEIIPRRGADINREPN